MVSGKNCLLTEPLYNTTFNFTSLSSDLAHVIDQQSYTINFNICNKLAKPCNGTTGVSACLTKKIGDKTVETILGSADSELGLQDGRLNFKFTGNKCNDKENHSLHMIMHCDYEHESGELSILPAVSFYLVFSSLIRNIDFSVNDLVFSAIKCLCVLCILGDEICLPFTA